ncbi:hypothetical protein [Gracilibacillus thailandensis]|uniref:DUF4355 domain-containing protein n=1 Tax=Gracilibacillus thailandensis TaxID=563735 RepID=A0A6N7QWK9_9BACI|nr:hypothetical protein [Gracilibacillus thailandensis]MRI65351.1 hypothetical protein [Gracilibacillus thailandensis]
MSEEKLFTQEEVNKIVQERLEREKRKTERELEQIRTEVPEGGTDYKKLYEELCKELAEREADEAKEQALLNAGFDQESVNRYKKYLDKVEEDEYEETAHFLFEHSPMNKKQSQSYADPSQKRGKSVWNPFK